MRLIALALCMSACNVGLVIQDDRNAPPPVDIRSPAPERPPPDPDLHFAYRSMRALLGGGFTAGGVRGAGGSYLGAMEGHLIYGRDAGIPDALGLRYPPGFPVVAVPDNWGGEARHRPRSRLDSHPGRRQAFAHSWSR